MLPPDRPVTVPQPATGNGKESRSIYPSVVFGGGVRGVDMTWPETAPTVKKPSFLSLSPSLSLLQLSLFSLLFLSPSLHFLFIFPHCDPSVLSERLRTIGREDKKGKKEQKKEITPHTGAVRQQLCRKLSRPASRSSFHNLLPARASGHASSTPAWFWWRRAGRAPHMPWTTPRVITLYCDSPPPSFSSRPRAPAFQSIKKSEKNSMHT